jgi:RNA polymerase sigma factor (sigma-70 family)
VADRVSSTGVSPGAAKPGISRGARLERSVSQMELPPFQRLLDEHRLDVYRFLVAAVGPQEADDCFQETFLSALRAYPRLGDMSNLKGWLITIATRKAMDHWRSSRRRAVPVGEVPERAATPIADGEPELWRSVGELPPMQRAAVIHRYVLDMTYADVANALGCSVEAARANAYEGRRKLREMQEAFA